MRPGVLTSAVQQGVGLLVPPAPLLPGGRDHLAHRFPEAQRAVPNGRHRCGHAAAAAISQQISPRLAGLAVTAGHGDNLLAAISTHPDHHQQAHFLLFQAHHIAQNRPCPLSCLCRIRHNGDYA
jgi:hypothetical protein